MSDLLPGTVTFLFSDIEGSTRLLQQLGDDYKTVLAEHRALMRAAFREAGGREVDRQGDSFFVIFRRAHDALISATAAQRAIMQRPWPNGSAVRVRMGLHTGEPGVVGDEYVGLDVHRAARICSAGHGGQILLSRTTRDLVEHDLPDGVTLRDLGRHRLKDLQHSEHLYQVLQRDLPADFPPLRSLDTLPNNLPRRLTSFIGREREMGEVRRLLAATYLLTIVGTGGAGKTRLALQVAADLMEEFAHGVWLIELAPVADEAHVAQAVASALGVREEQGRPLHATLADHLKIKHLLLVLDNCEHLVAPIAELANRLLSAAPHLRILCTSREALGIEGEVAWRIPSLGLPDVRRLPGLEALTQYEAIRLFVERSRAALPGFALTAQNAPIIARICQRLDGIPLAIELAAARVKVLTAEQIAARLDDRFRLLTGGSRTAYPRQQTLLAAMDWSYDLLSEVERAVLRRLSVFSGGWSLEAAEGICAGDAVSASDVLDLLVRLIDKSLVVVDEHDQQAHYRMLETVRQYGQRKLVEAGEAQTFRLRHRDWFVAFADRLAPLLQGPDQGQWLDRLEDDHDNLRAALDWSLCCGDPDGGLRMAGAMWWFWYIRGHLTEGREWLEQLLLAAPTPTPQRIEALVGAGVLTYFVGDVARARELADEGLRLSRDLRDDLGVAFSLLTLSLGDFAQEPQRAADLVDESLGLFRKTRHQWGTGLALAMLGRFANLQGEYERAGRLFEEGLTFFRQAGDRWGIALATHGLGLAARFQGDYDRAAALHAESLTLSRALGDKMGTAYALQALGFIQYRKGEYDRAAAAFSESLALATEAGYKEGMADALYFSGLVEEYQGRHEKAAALLNESMAMFRALGSTVGVAQALGNLGRVALHEGAVDRAEALAQESLGLFREVGDRRGAASSSRLLGEIALHQGHGDRAKQFATESLTEFRELGDRWAIGYALRLLAAIAINRKDYGTAAGLCRESLTLHREHGDTLGIVKCLEGLGIALGSDGQPEHAVRLVAAAEAVREAIRAPLTHPERVAHEKRLAQLRAAVGESAFMLGWTEGRAMTLEQAIEEALTEDAHERRAAQKP